MAERPAGPSADLYRPLYSGPILIIPAMLLFGLAVLEKILNMMGTSIPIVEIFPSQILSWAVVLLLFEIAFTLRQMLELQRADLAELD